MKKLVTLLCILSLCLTLAPISQAEAGQVQLMSTGTQVSNVDVILRDNVVYRNVSYYINFTTGKNLTGGRDTITLLFPKEVIISQEISRINVAINGREAAGLNYHQDTGTLTVMVPSSFNIMAGERVEIGIASAVIKNPRQTGYYQIGLSTSQDTREVKSPAFFITDYEYSNGVSKPTVTLSTSAKGQSPQYRLNFKTSPNGRLVGESDKIHLIFPTGTELPSRIDGQYLTVNGYPLTGQYLVPEGQKLTLTLPWNLQIPAGGVVELLIASGANIKNPGPSQYHILKVATSSEPREISSFPYETTEEISATPENRIGLSVVATPNYAYENAQYTIIINPRVLYRLDSTISGLTLTFPSGTSLPATMASEHLKVNGLTPRGVLVDPARQELFLLLPGTISASEQILITINKEAGLKNPGPAQYKMDVGLLRSPGTVLSDWFVITTNPGGPTPPANTTPAPVIPVPPANQNSLPSSKKITLRIDSVLAQIGDTIEALQSPPVIINDVTLVPLRFVATALGATAEFDSTGNYALVKYGAKEMYLWVNSKLAKVNGVFVNLAVPATIINDRLMVPIRFISENFGAEVAWDGATRAISITPGASSPSIPVTTTPTPTPPPAPANPSPPASQYPVGAKAYVRSSNTYVNVRTGPGTNYELVTRIFQGEPMTIIKVQDNWYQVRLSSGREAWVANHVVEVRS